MIDIRLIGKQEGHLLEKIAPDVFDHPLIEKSTREFLDDHRHHLAIAIEMDLDLVVGMASGVHYIHPDKKSELWINEVGVSPAYRNRGLAKSLVGCLLQLGRDLGCMEAWVLTDGENAAALRLYEGCGGVRTRTDPIMYEFRLH